MADDLVERLRKLADDMERHATEDWDEHEDVRSAADRITALQAQNRKLVEALTKINVGEGWAAQIARAAIAEAEKGEG